MPIYEYVARDSEGQQHTGVVSAVDEKDARRLLRNRELFATDLRKEGRGWFRSLARLLKPAS